MAARSQRVLLGALATRVNTSYNPRLAPTEIRRDSQQRPTTPHAGSDDSATEPHAAAAILVASNLSTPSSTGSSSSILESFS